jgi:hypothetical protein
MDYTLGVLYFLRGEAWSTTNATRGAPKEKKNETGVYLADGQ